MYQHPETGEPLESAYDRGYYAADTGEPEPPKGDPERMDWLHGCAVRGREEDIRNVREVWRV